MSVILGKELKIYNGSNALISGAKSCVINKQADSIEVASASNATAKTYIAGRYGWSVSISHLITTNQGGIPMVGQTYTITYKVGSTSVYSGTAICVEAEISGTVGNIAQGSIKLLGTGPLSAV